MAAMHRAPGYDRTRILEAAARARAHKRRRRAIALYRRVLAVERNNPELYARLAPLLAETGQRFDAWLSFQATARACLRQGLLEEALLVYRHASGYLPREHRVWQEIARIERRRGREREAAQALLEGSRQLHSRRLRPAAIHLLRQARLLAPWDFAICFELARVLAKSWQLAEARMILEGLARTARGARLRRVRGALLRLDADIRNVWLWLVALVSARGETEAPAAEGASVVPLRSRAARR